MKIIMLIIAIIIVAFIALFSYCACVVSSQCNKYEGYHRKSDEDETRKDI